MRVAVTGRSVGPPLFEALEVLGERWTLLILRDAFRGVRRFDQIQRDLGIARNLLTDRLTKRGGVGVIIDAGRFAWEYNKAEKATQVGARFAAEPMTPALQDIHAALVRRIERRAARGAMSSNFSV